MNSLIVAGAAGAAALVFAIVLTFRVIREDEGNSQMKEIGRAIKEGALAFLRREYLVLLPFILVVAVALWALIDWWTNDSLVPKTAISYLAGTLCSATAGFVGMNVAIRANVRTAAAGGQGTEPGIAGRFQQRCRHGRNGGGDRAAGSHHPLHHLAGCNLCYRLRLWGLFHSPVRQGGRRNLHQGGRCWFGPGGQGGSGHPRG